MREAKDSTTAECKSCGNAVDINHSGPCPKCGEKGKLIKKVFNVQIKVKPKLTLVAIREYLEYHKAALVIAILFTLVAAVAGSMIKGVFGLVSGIAISLLAFFFGLRGVIKVREREKRGSN
ncbi:MAG: hypothetical protein L0Y74_01075 [candidate division Zixibacteria bacterium]|nr:hypothetical protein [candidate division Zixibacteria bacterium]